MEMIDSDDDDDENRGNLRNDALPFGTAFLVLAIVAVIAFVILLTRDDDVTTFCIVSVVEVATATAGRWRSKIRSVGGSFYLSFSGAKTQCTNQFLPLFL